MWQTSIVPYTKAGNILTIIFYLCQDVFSTIV